jgi:hypothetical protein
MAGSQQDVLSTLSFLIIKAKDGRLDLRERNSAIFEIGLILEQNPHLQGAPIVQENADIAAAAVSQVTVVKVSLYFPIAHLYLKKKRFCLRRNCSENARVQN